MYIIFVNQKQELPVVAMFVNGSGQNEQYLERIFHRCFLPSFSSFGWGVSEEKIKMQKVNGRCDMRYLNLAPVSHMAYAYHTCTAVWENIFNLSIVFHFTFGHQNLCTLAYHKVYPERWRGIKCNENNVTMLKMLHNLWHQ
jgi:hypothetical protein